MITKENRERLRDVSAASASPNDDALLREVQELIGRVPDFLPESRPELRGGPMAAEASQVMSLKNLLFNLVECFDTHARQSKRAIMELTEAAAIMRLSRLPRDARRLHEMENKALSVAAGGASSARAILRNIRAALASDARRSAVIAAAQRKSVVAGVHFVTRYWLAESAAVYHLRGKRPENAEWRSDQAARLRHWRSVSADSRKTVSMMVKRYRGSKYAGRMPEGVPNA